MKNIFIHLVLILSPLMLFSQVDLVINGVDFKIMSTTDVKLDNTGMSNKNNATINNEGNIYLDLDWTQTGTLTSYTGNGWMWYEGSADQTLSGPS
ncbi:MAG: hypothetical protein MK207_14855, partial [Saprospiraceae bacterium]|nr:hypothetical protein [Saprospiraceae bacterium]